MKSENKELFDYIVSNFNMDGINRSVLKINIDGFCSAYNKSGAYSIPPNNKGCVTTHSLQDSTSYWMIKLNDQFALLPTENKRRSNYSSNMKLQKERLNNFEKEIVFALETIKRTNKPKKKIK